VSQLREALKSTGDKGVFSASSFRVIGKNGHVHAELGLEEEPGCDPRVQLRFFTADATPTITLGIVPGTGTIVAGEKPSKLPVALLSIGNSVEIASSIAGSHLHISSQPENRTADSQQNKPTPSIQQVLIELSVDHASSKTEVNVGTPFSPPLLRVAGRAITFNQNLFQRLFSRVFG
jgi:hypothetical protein